MEKIIEANGSKGLHNLWLRNSENVKPTECQIKGTIPSWLNGHLIRNGPGEYKVGDDYFKHMFDGHALIHKYTICNGKVTYMSNFVNSEDYKVNHQNKRIVMAGYGTSSIPDPCQNIFSRFFTKFFSRAPAYHNASVNVANLGETYYAVTDAAVLHRLNSETLDTEQCYLLSELFGMVATTAHPHTDVNGDYYNLGIHAGRTSYYGVYKVPASSMDKFDPMEDLKVHAKIESDSPLKPCYFHSFGLSQNYITLHEHPVRYNSLKLLMGTLTWDAVMNGYDYEAERESMFRVLDKNSQETLPIKYCSKGRFTFHHINSYEQTVNDRKYLIVDLCCAEGPTFFYFWLHILADDNSPEKMKEPHMWPYRFVLPLDVSEETPKDQNLVEISGCQATAVKREDDSVFLTPELLVEDGFSDKYGMWGMEFPTINYNEYNTKPYKYMYSVGEEGNGKFNCLFKINVETKESIQWKEEGYFPSEPVFVKNPNSSDEDDGIVLSSVVNLNPQDPIFLLVLDAKTFTELGRAEIMAKLTYSFHGVFSSNQ